MAARSRKSRGASFWCDQSITLAGSPSGVTASATEQPFLRVGSHAESELYAAGWPSRAAYLHATPAGIFCLDLRDRDVEPNLTGWLRESQPLNIGDIELPLQLPGGLPQPPAKPLTARGTAPAPWPVLTISFEGATHEKILRRGLVVAGRSSDCYLKFASRKLSRKHCVLHSVAGRLWVIDFFSSNGTKVDGEAIDVQEVPVGGTIDLAGVAQIEFKRVATATPSVGALLSRSAENNTPPAEAVGVESSSDVVADANDLTQTSPLSVSSPGDATSPGQARRSEELLQQLDELQQDRDHLADEVQQLQQRCADGHEELLRVRQELELQRAEDNAERRTLEQRTEELAKHEAELKKRGTQIDQREAELTRNENDHRVEREKSAKLQQELREQESQLRQREREYGQLRQDWEAEQEQIRKELSAREEALGNRAKAIEDESTTQGQTLAAVAARQQQMEEREAELAKQLESLRLAEQELEKQRDRVATRELDVQQKEQQLQQDRTMPAVGNARIWRTHVPNWPRKSRNGSSNGTPLSHSARAVRPSWRTGKRGFSTRNAC